MANANGCRLHRMLDEVGVEPVRGQGRLKAHDSHGHRIESGSWLDGAVYLDHSSWRCGAVELEWQAPQHLVVVTERGGSSRTEVKIGGETRYAGRDRPGSLSFIPAGAQRTCLYERADLAYTALWIDPCLALDLPAGSTFRFR